MFSENRFTEFGEFPWMLGVFRNEETGEEGTQRIRFFCGASLIHPQVALTGAVCVSR
jgi:secreted trypsin-like serine protease